ncbi:MAG: aromatic ring-hydroxylating dioxygenase subunit alpha [Rivularia sp. (in: Bacteria)]|nr:aromatic ring-hydroxylating dioxygenase subunit alpha [Rivularia sp. MS3]
MKQSSSSHLCFPNGWFRIAYSNEIPPKTVKPLHYFGQDLVLFRTEKGVVRVFDAHCSHLGAHLGYGGIVKNETIQCPFHGWCFNNSGNCTQIPYTNKIPPKAQIRTWPVREVNGLIMIYYHSQGHSPDWEIPELPEFLSQNWTSLLPVIRRKSSTSTQEVGEGSIVDTAHFSHLHPHTFDEIKGESLVVSYPTLTYKMYPEYNLSGVAKILGVEGKTSLDFTSYGLGCLVVRSSSKAMVEIETLTMFLLTPINQNSIDFHFLVSIKKVLNKPITALLKKFIKDSAIKTLKEDMKIWENKIFRTHPLLCDGDGPIAQYRRWVSEFYTDISVPL